LWIEVRDPNLLTDLFEIDKSQYNEVVNGRKKKIVTDGASIQYVSHYTCDSIDMPTWAILTIEIVKNMTLPIVVSILSKYLYDKLKSRKDSKVLINNQQVEIDAEKISHLIINNVNLYFSHEEKDKMNQNNRKNQSK
jgi:hypothetical protein